MAKKFYSRVVIDMETLQVVEADEFEYEGPVAECCGGGGGGGGGDASIGADFGVVGGQFGGASTGGTGTGIGGGIGGSVGGVPGGDPGDFGGAAVGDNPSTSTTSSADSMSRSAKILSSLSLVSPVFGLAGAALTGLSALGAVPDSSMADAADANQFGPGEPVAKKKPARKKAVSPSEATLAENVATVGSLLAPLADIAKKVHPLGVVGKPSIRRKSLLGSA